MSNQYPTTIGGEHKHGGTSQDLDKVYEPSSDRIASDAGKAHAYAGSKVEGSGPGAGKDVPDPNAERGYNAGSGETGLGGNGKPAPAIV
ncbi:hypothetical protein JCM8097_007197 [Rhodosporidiobolus ruineniae]